MRSHFYHVLAIVLCTVVTGVGEVLCRETGPHRRSARWRYTATTDVYFNESDCAPKVLNTPLGASNYILSDTLGVEEVGWRRGAFVHRDGRSVVDPTTAELNQLYGDYRWTAYRHCLIPLADSSSFVGVFVNNTTVSGYGELRAVHFSFDGSVPTTSVKLESAPTNTLSMILVDYSVVENASGDGFWLLVLSRGRNGIIAYPLSALGIGNPVVNQWRNLSFTEPYSGLTADPSGTRLAMSGVYGGCALARFNRATGVVDEEVSVPISSEFGRPRESLSFSQDGSKLYMNMNGYNTDIVQIDLKQPTIEGVSASATTVISTSNAAWWGESDLQLGPDGKLYITVPYEIRTVNGLADTSTYLATIHCPNEPGMNCMVDTFLLPNKRGYYLERTVQTWLQLQYTFGVDATNVVDRTLQDSLVIDPTVESCASSYWELPDGNIVLRNHLSIPIDSAVEGAYRFVQWKCSDTIVHTYYYKAPYISVRLPDTTSIIGSQLHLPVYVRSTRVIEPKFPVVVEITFRRQCLIAQMVSGLTELGRTNTDSSTTLQLLLHSVDVNSAEQIAGYVTVVPLLSIQNRTPLVLNVPVKPVYLSTVVLTDGFVTAAACGSDKRNIRFNDVTSPITLTIHDMQGREVHRSIVSTDTNDSAQVYSQLRTGVYFEMYNNGYQVRSRMVANF